MSVMMIIIIVVIAVLFIAILLLTGHVPGKKISREEFLTKFEKHVEGKKASIEGFENSFRIDFNFEGHKFFVEDIESIGFKDKVYKFYLKYQMDNKLTLGFSEKMTEVTVRSDIIIVSDLPKQAGENKAKVFIPQVFSDMKIYSNNIELANRLLADNKIVSILTQYKNTDNRGIPFLSLKIVEGVISIQFHESSILKPSLFALQRELAILEEYLDHLIFIANKLRKTG